MPQPPRNPEGTLPNSTGSTDSTDPEWIAMTVEEERMMLDWLKSWDKMDRYRERKVYREDKRSK